MAKRPSAPKSPKKVDTLRHPDDKRVNIPTAEHQSVLEAEHLERKEIRYPRNTDLDPQLVWRGKDYQDWSDLVVQAPPLYIQEKVHPKVLIDDLLRESKGAKAQESGAQIDLFADFNGVAEGTDRTDFYQHDQNWTNRMILGDSLQVMTSLAEREGLRGKVQCIYIDPPYGIRFNSNFQWSTTSREVKDGNAAHITREPEQVKAFRDTWRDGIHSYLTYLRDRLTVARDLLSESGSLFVQIGDENVQSVRALLDEVFGLKNCVSTITFKKTSGAGSLAGGTSVLPAIADYLLWYAKSIESVKYRQLFLEKEFGGEGASQYRSLELPTGQRRSMTAAEVNDPTVWPSAARPFGADNLTSPTGVDTTRYDVRFSGKLFRPHPAVWKTSSGGMQCLARSNRLVSKGRGLYYVRFLADFPGRPLTNLWTDTQPGSVFAGADERLYVVQTTRRVVQRCLLMATDPGDLVLDPTCGSGTTAHVAEQWGRRWITIDTSRVALALARARIMGARYPYYLLADSPEGLRKEAEVGGRAFADKPTHGNVRHGFVYERVPHITLKSIANNAEIDVLYDEHQPRIQEALQRVNEALRGHASPFRVTAGGREGNDIHFDASSDASFAMPSGEVVSASKLAEWEVPYEAPPDWPEAARKPLADFWDARIARQKAIDASIAARGESELLYDRPYADPKTVRVAGPFTVESLSPHRTLGVDENDELIDPLQVKETSPTYGQTFEQMILDNLRAAGVQQAHKTDRITFTSMTAWPGEMVCAEGRFREGDGDKEKRAAIFIGPEFGTVSRPDLVQAAREAGDAGFDVLIACAFNYEAHASEFSKLGRIPVLKARMNADLHMGGELTPDAVLFAAPCRSMAGAEDLALSLPGRPDGDTRIRVGLVHGSTFDMEGYQTSFPIARDAPKQRGLDYLAVGDTHGFRVIAEGGLAPIVYPGAPEQTRFGESGAGQVVLVTLARSGARPTVTPLKVGRLTWRDESVTSLESLRRLASEDLMTTVLRLRLDMTVSVADEKTVDQLTRQLKGDDANSGRAGAFVLDRSRLRVEVGNVSDLMQDAPATLSMVAGKLAAAAAVDDEAQRALQILYRLMSEARA